jgi:PhoH-like ATPase
MKAKAVGVQAEDYTTDKIHNVEELYSGKETIDNFSHDIIEKLYQPPYEIPVKSSLKKYKAELVPNKFFVLKNASHSVLASLDVQKETLRKVDKNSVYGIKPRNAEQTFAIDALTNLNIPLVTTNRKSRDWKTLLALASAVHIKKYYRQFHVARPVVPLSNKDISYCRVTLNQSLHRICSPCGIT